MNTRLPLLTAVAFGVLAACGSDNPRAADIAATAGDADAGEALFSLHCASCHGDDGAGDSNITGELFHSDEQLAGSILDGVDGMPAFEEQLTDEEVAYILAFMRTW